MRNRRSQAKVSVNSSSVPPKPLSRRQMSQQGMYYRWQVSGRFVGTTGLEHRENALLSRLHSKPAMGLVPGVAKNVMRIECETVVPPFNTVAPFPSTTEVIVVCGGCEAAVAITEIVPPRRNPSLESATYKLPLAESKAIPDGGIPTGIGIGLPITVLV